MHVTGSVSPDDPTLDDRLDRVVDTDLLRVLCEPVRVQILTHLARCGPCDIGQIAGAFPQDRSVISRHLQQHERVGILGREKRSRSVIYTVDGTALLEKMEGMVGRVRELVAVCCPPATDDD